MARYFEQICRACVLVYAMVFASSNAAAQLIDSDVVFASDQSDEAQPLLPLSPLSTPPQAPRSYYTGASTSTSTASNSNITADPLVGNSAVGCPNGDCGTVAGCQCGQHYCGNCDCGNCCNGCFPRWYVEAEAIFLWRNNDSVVQPVVLSSQTTSTVFNTHSADFDTGIGPRTLIGLRTSQSSAWECQYFSAIDMTGSGSVISPGQLTTPGQFPQLPGWSNFSAASVDYSSELHNVEINYLRYWNNLSLLGGFRFVRLSENYGLSVYDIGRDAYNTHSENNLFGAQLGGRWRECRNKFFWEFTGKAGIFGNDANQSQFLTSGDGSTIQRNITSYQSCVAFVGDLNLSIGFRMNQVWAARCGYNVIWIDQVALAADQLDFNLGTNAGRAIATNGDVILHGINVGLEGRW
ncbi:MAG: BBP7 family outer membrane beta-barrel protein [Pirellulales bacterium]|nr:BBP7 family outer membrane beta-barrel protein [Pirellulales bacterium]